MLIVSGENAKCVPKRITTRSLGLAFAVVSLIVGGAEATLGPGYDLPVAITRADLLVQGQVVSTSSSWVGGPFGANIYTHVHLRVKRVLKGGAAADVIDFVVMGGTVGDVTQRVSDLPAFDVNEEVLVLLTVEDEVPTGLEVMPGYGKTAIHEGNVQWKGSALPVEEFLEALETFIENPAMDLDKHLRSIIEQSESHEGPAVDQAEIELTDRTASIASDGLPVRAGDVTSETAARETMGPSSMTAEEEVEASGTEVMRLTTPRKEASPDAIRNDHLEELSQSQRILDKFASPDLLPYKGPSWDSTIVLSTVTGTSSTASTIYDDQTIYTDWGCGNFGSGDAGHFRYGLYIDGSRVLYVDQSSLAAGYATYAEDGPVGPLSAGIHTFKIVCDYDFEVSESNESNNEYSRTFTIAARTQLPDLRPHKGSGWDNTIVLSTVTGTNTTAGTIYDHQTIYADFGCGNYGTGDAGHFRYGFYIDGSRVGYVDRSSLAAGSASVVADASVDPLSAGLHTFKVVCDYDSEVVESNESNNEYSRTITVSTPPPGDTEISSVSPDRGSAGTSTEVTINGSDFGSSQGSGKVEFWYGRGSAGDPDRIEAPISSWSDTQIVCEIPVDTLNNYSASASSGPLRVVVDSGAASNEVTFVVTFSYMGVKWDDLLGAPHVPYRVNESTSDCTGEGAAVIAGAQVWNSAGSGFTFEYTGAHTNTEVGLNSYNDIMWSDTLPAGTLAQASFWSIAGVMFETDVAYNDDYPWSADATPAPSEFDIQSILTHELGHWLSLRDLYGDIGDGVNDPGKVMYGRAGAGEVKRNLHADDASGIVWIYGTDDSSIFSDGFESDDCSAWSHEVN